MKEKFNYCLKINLATFKILPTFAVFQVQVVGSSRIFLGHVRPYCHTSCAGIAPLAAGATIRMPRHTWHELKSRDTVSGGMAAGGPTCPGRLHAASTRIISAAAAIACPACPPAATAQPINTHAAACQCRRLLRVWARRLCHLAASECSLSCAHCDMARNEMCSAQPNTILLASHGAVRCAQHGMVRDQTRSVHTNTE